MKGRRGSWLILAVLALALGLIYWAITRSRPGPESTTTVTDPLFTDVAESAGLRFKHFDPATPQHLMPETMGSGVGWVDFDRDGWPDLVYVQDGPLPPASIPNPPTHKLYRNQRDGTFADVTDAVGLNQSGYGVGVAVGDYDNDGYDDVLIVGLARIWLYHNVPGGPQGRRFEEVAEAAGLSTKHYATSAAWGDLDNDGDLDLYLCHYVEIDPAKPLVCHHDERDLPYQCSPTAFPLTTHRLYRNNGNGTFTDMTAGSGIAGAPKAPGLAVAIADLDGDGRQDIYVANDLHPAYLFHNRGNFTFQDVAASSGCALGVGGSRMAGMGIEVGDLDGTGRPSLFVTNYQSSPNTVFFNRGNLRFHDGTNSSGLGPASLSKLGFGCALLDANLDGLPDLAVANGHVQRMARELFGVPYAQETQLFLNEGSAKYKEATAQAGAAFRTPRVGRGLARADFNRDGAPDLALSGVGEPAVLFRHRGPGTNRWIEFDLIGNGTTSNRNAIGAVVTVMAGGKTQTHFLVGGGSYLSAHDRRIIVGLGPTAEKVDMVTVRWPSGASQTFPGLTAGRIWRLTEGGTASAD